MNKNRLASKISNALSESVCDSGDVALETISLRPNTNVAAMVSVLNERLGLTVSTLFLDAISERLYELLLESKKNESLILGLLEEVVKVGTNHSLSVTAAAQGSALALLVDRGALTYDLSKDL